MSEKRYTASLSGDICGKEVTLFGVCFFARQRRQKWSPTMNEVEVERGVRFGTLRISFATTHLRFLDEKAPQLVRRVYGL